MVTSSRNGDISRRYIAIYVLRWGGIAGHRLWSDGGGHFVLPKPMKVSSVISIHLPVVPARRLHLQS